MTLTDDQKQRLRESFGMRNGIQVDNQQAAILNFKVCFLVFGINTLDLVAYFPR